MSTMTLEQVAPSAADLASGKGHTDENFPVASVLIAPQHRPVVMAFYAFARAADDVADNPQATPETKLSLLEAMRATLAGESDADAKTLALRDIQTPLGLSPQHGFDLLEAFRRDVTKLRYADWGELMDYCRYSAAPVGRSCLMSTARAAPPGPPMMRSARPFRSSTTSRTAPRTTAIWTASISLPTS